MADPGTITGGDEVTLALHGEVGRLYRVERVTTTHAYVTPVDRQPGEAITSAVSFGWLQPVLPPVDSTLPTVALEPSSP